MSFSTACRGDKIIRRLLSGRRLAVGPTRNLDAAIPSVVYYNGPSVREMYMNMSILEILSIYFEIKITF